MKISKFFLSFLYIIFLLNGLGILCLPEDGMKRKGKKKKVKKRRMVDKGTQFKPESISDSLELQKLADAQEILQTVLQEEELRLSEKKKKRARKIATIVFSTIAVGLLLALGGVGSYVGYKNFIEPDLKKEAPLPEEPKEKAPEPKSTPSQSSSSPKKEKSTGGGKESSVPTGSSGSFPEWNR